MQSRTRYDRNKKSKIQTRNGFQVEKEDKTVGQLNVEKLYNFEDPDLDIFYDLSEFLSQEIMLMKSENVEKTKNCEIKNENTNREVLTTGKENFDNFTSKTIPQFSKESTSSSPRLEAEKRNDCNINFPNKIVGEIYTDFSEMEDKEYKNLKNNLDISISKIYFRKKIKWTYSNKKPRRKFNLPKDSISINASEILSDKVEDIETSKIDVILSQPVSDNLVKLSSYFMSNDKLDTISQDENLNNTPNSIDLQKLFNRGEILFFGRLTDLDPVFGYNPNQRKIIHPGTSKIESSEIKCHNDFGVEFSKNFEKTNIQLSKIKEILSPQYQIQPQSPKFKIPRPKTPPLNSNFSDHNELWPDEDLLQNIEIMETEANKPAKSKDVLKTNSFLTCNNLINKTPKRKSNIDYSNFSLKQENHPVLKRRTLDLKTNSSEKSDFKIEESMPEFLTASQKEIHRSHEALSRATSLIQCDTESIIEPNETPKRRSNIEFSNYSLKEKNHPVLKRRTLDLKTNYSENSDFEIEESMPGFITASQKEIRISHDALSRAKSLIQCDTESTNEPNETPKRRSNIEFSKFSLKQENPPVSKRRTLDLKTNYSEKSDFEIEESMPGFITASQKKIHISHEALSRAKNLIQCDTESSDELNIRK